MTKYFGILVLIISLISIKYLDNKISDAEKIIADFIESEFRVSEGYINYFKDLNKRTSKEDSVATSIIQLHEQLQNIDPYSEKLRNKILIQSKESSNQIFHTLNISLFNNICKNIIKENKNRIHQDEYELIIDRIDYLNNDSCELIITPIILIDDLNTIQFYHNNKYLDRTELENFKGELQEVEAKIKNPITGEMYPVICR